MTRGPGATPARSRSPVEALEAQIEAMWLRLGELSPGQRRTVRLSPHSGRLALVRPSEDPTPGDVGTYDHTVSLCALRDDVFWLFGSRP